jgi:hypothetical protein
MTEPESAMWTVIVNGEAQTVRSILESGFDVHTEDCNGRDVLSIAIYTAPLQCDIIEILLEYGANLNNKPNDRSALSLWAIDWCRTCSFPEQLLSVLMRYGAAPLLNTRDSGTSIPLTPLVEAAAAGRQMVLLLNSYREKFGQPPCNHNSYASVMRIRNEAARTKAWILELQKTLGQQSWHPGHPLSYASYNKLHMELIECKRNFQRVSKRLEEFM